MSKEKLSEEELERIRKGYPKGSRVAVEYMKDWKKGHSIHFGDMATVGEMNEYGYLDLHFDKGLTFKSNPDIDILRIIK